MVDPTGHAPWWLDILNFAKELVTNVAPQVAMADGPGMGPADVASAGVLVCAAAVAVVGGAAWLGGKVDEAIHNSTTTTYRGDNGGGGVSVRHPSSTTSSSVIDGAIDKPFDLSWRLNLTKPMDKTKDKTIADTATDTKEKEKPNASYWPADLIGRTVVVQWQLPLDYNAAVIRVGNSGSIMCRSEEAARIVANSFPHPVGPEISGGGQLGFLPHYHPDRSSKAHIWFSPME